VDRRTTRQPGYGISLSRRRLIENGFGWLKQTGPLRQAKLRGLEKVDWLFIFICAAHNPIPRPVFNLFLKKTNSFYVTGGGGFYHKSTNFTVQQRCDFYGYPVNVTANSFTSN
jgi:hypothetical protein